MNALRLVIRTAQTLNMDPQRCASPIRVNVKRATLMKQGRDCAPLKPRGRGGRLFLWDHEIITADA